MIHEVDAVLRGLIREEALSGADVEVVLDAPTREWAARRNTPTVNMYLYDLREDLRRRQQGTLTERDADGAATTRHAPPRYVRLSYLITAWTQRPEDEHQLLGAMLHRLLGCDRLPPERLVGSLAELGLPVPVSVAAPPPEDRGFAEVWTALGGELKPSLDVAVSAPLLVSPGTRVGPPVTEGMRLTLAERGGGDRARDELGHLVQGEPPARHITIRRRTQP
ncbi:DUF4255 domain-containing protein [Nonomuraea polychroma]|uniref:DUF4255 domain-containing protein n=1 Tax=Nonomuraea polychroma TaxID=46176 RepID=UPI003D91DE60